MEQIIDNIIQLLKEGFIEEAIGELESAKRNALPLPAPAGDFEDAVRNQLIHKYGWPEDGVVGFIADCRSLSALAPMPICLDDCENREGRFCTLSVNPCIRRAQDYYKQKGA